MRQAARVVAVASALLLTGCGTHQQPDAAATADRYGVAAAPIGTVWRYGVTSDRGSSTIVRRLSGVHRAADGTIYSITDSASGWTRTLPYLVHRDGSVIEPVGQVLVPAAGYTLKVRSGAISLPPAPVLEAGTPRTSRLVLDETNGARNLDVLLTAITRGVGTEQVTVPAGSYAALHLHQAMTETAGGHEIRYVTDSWYAPHVGLVRAVSAMTRTAGITSTATQVLESRTRGSVKT